MGIDNAQRRSLNMSYKYRNPLACRPRPYIARIFYHFLSGRQLGRISWFFLQRGKKRCGTRTRLLCICIDILYPHNHWTGGNWGSPWHIQFLNHRHLRIGCRTSLVSRRGSPRQGRCSLGKLGLHRFALHMSICS